MMKMNGADPLEMLLGPDMALRDERIPHFTGDVDNQAGSSTMFIRMRRGALTLANGANDNVALGAESFYRAAGPSAVFNVSGFTGGSAGRLLFLYNTVAFAMTITDDADSDAANRILTLTGADVTLRAGTSFAAFIYDSSASRWILMATN